MTTKKLKLTRPLVEGFEFAGKTPKSADYRWDTEVRGFGVRVWASGEKTYVVFYRSNMRQRFLTIGKHGAITLHQARELARLRLAEVAQGRDPAAEKKFAREALTVREFLKVYVERHAKPRKKASTLRSDLLLIDNHIVPAFGGIPLRALSAADVSKLHAKVGSSGGVRRRKKVVPLASATDPVPAGAKRRRKRTPDGSWSHYALVYVDEVGPARTTTANRILDLISNVWEKALLWGHLRDPSRPDLAPPDNPTKGIERFRERKRKRFVKAAEMPRLLAAIDAERNHYARAAIWLYLLTGFRKMEVLTLRWEDVDFDERLITARGTKTAGQHGDNTHTIPMSSAARHLLEQVMRMRSNPYVFCSNRYNPVTKKRDKHLVNITKPWDRVRRQADVADVRLHDLRRTVGSWLVQEGNSLELIGQVLNHTSTSTTKIYAHFSNDPLRKALEAHGDRLTKLAAPESHD